MKENTKLTNKQMVEEVDRHIEEIGLNDEILGLKTNEDKILYYYNYLDENNRFRGILEFNSFYYIKLANLLCNTTERLKIFQEKFYNPNDNVALQFRQYRRYLLDSRENTDEYLDVIDKMIKGQLWEELHSTLQELFFEPISQGIFDRIKDMIHNDLNAEDIYNFYTTGRNIKSIITFNINYIHTLHK